MTIIYLFLSMVLCLWVVNIRRFLYWQCLWEFLNLFLLNFLIIWILGRFVFIYNWYCGIIVVIIKYLLPSLYNLFIQIFRIFRVLWFVIILARLNPLNRAFGLIFWSHGWGCLNLANFLFLFEIRLAYGTSLRIVLSSNASLSGLFD